MRRAGHPDQCFNGSIGQTDGCRWLQGVIPDYSITSLPRTPPPHCCFFFFVYVRWCQTCAVMLEKLLSVAWKRPGMRWQAQGGVALRN